jgi:hypothetical protein
MHTPRSFTIWGTVTAKSAPDGDVLVHATFPHDPN